MVTLRPRTPAVKASHNDDSAARGRRERCTACGGASVVRSSCCEHLAMVHGLDATQTHLPPRHKHQQSCVAYDVPVVTRHWRRASAALLPYS